jgi:hypothetical protein
MPPNNRSRSSRQRLPTDLEARYGKIGIPAVVAAARYSSDRIRERAARSKTLAGGIPIGLLNLPRGLFLIRNSAARARFMRGAFPNRRSPLPFGARRPRRCNLRALRHLRGSRQYVVASTYPVVGVHPSVPADETGCRPGRLATPLLYAKPPEGVL